MTMSMYENGDGLSALRLCAMDAIRNYMGDQYKEDKYSGYDLLKLLLNKEDNERLTQHFTPEDKAICESLIGPYGYTVFRMLCVKRGVNLSTKTV